MRKINTKLGLIISSLNFFTNQIIKIQATMKDIKKYIVALSDTVLVTINFPKPFILIISYLSIGIYHMRIIDKGKSKLYVIPI